MIVQLKNQGLEVKIDSKGAELISILANDGHEYIWEGNPDVWGGHAPILFPIVGGIIDDEFVYDGKTYPLEKHGFARHMEFEVEACDKTSATFVLRDNEQTLSQYPFSFAFRVYFLLDGNKLVITYSVENTDNKTIYFSFGAHEAYACAGGISNYSLEFEKEELLSSSRVDGNFLNGISAPILTSGNKLQMKDEYFEEDALIFEKISSKKVCLRRNDGKKAITVEYSGFPNLLIWTKPNAEYLCIEPWDGIPDALGDKKELETKSGLVALCVGEKYAKTHTIILEDEAL